jgi:tubulin polyglutamylase TTLL1
MDVLVCRFVHLTNVAVQKGGGDDCNAAHGNKWALADLRLHLEATRGHAATQQLFTDMQQLVVHTLKAVQPVGPVTITYVYYVQLRL